MVSLWSHTRRWTSGRWAHIALRLLIAVTVLVVAAVLAITVLILRAPSVTNAPAKVAAILAAHHASSDDGVIPQKVATALLATEDSRYYGDPALDPLGVTRAAIPGPRPACSPAWCRLRPSTTRLTVTPGPAGTLI
jgi:penicillin-binding protein 1A